MHATPFRGDIAIEAFSKPSSSFLVDTHCLRGHKPGFCCATLHEIYAIQQQELVRRPSFIPVVTVFQQLALTHRHNHAIFIFTPLVNSFYYIADFKLFLALAATKMPTLDVALCETVYKETIRVAAAKGCTPVIYALTDHNHIGICVKPQQAPFPDPQNGVVVTVHTDVHPDEVEMACRRANVRIMFGPEMTQRVMALDDEDD
jgi:hypothetical protein